MVSFKDWSALMKYKDLPPGIFVDRHREQIDLVAIDVVMLTLDAEAFLDRCLCSVYREIPVRRLLVCDGGSKDSTIDILSKYPRVQLFIKPEIRTTGKALEFLFSLVETEWFAIIDADIELGYGWYDEMQKHENEYDMLENSRRLLAYHIYREDLKKLSNNGRPDDFCYLGRKESVKGFRCDDDYVWRITDYFFRQQVEKLGYRYGKISSTHHTHHETERLAYESIEEKKFMKLVLKPEWIIVNKSRYDDVVRSIIMGLVKYMDPEHLLVRGHVEFDDMMIKMLGRDWVARNGPKWLSRYDDAHSFRNRLRRIMLLRRRVVPLSIRRIVVNKLAQLRTKKKD